MEEKIFDRYGCYFFPDNFANFISKRDVIVILTSNRPLKTPDLTSKPFHRIITLKFVD